MVAGNPPFGASSVEGTTGWLVLKANKDVNHHFGGVPEKKEEKKHLLKSWKMRTDPMKDSPQTSTPKHKQILSKREQPTVSPTLFSWIPFTIQG